MDCALGGHHFVATESELVTIFLNPMQWPDTFLLLTANDFALVARWRDPIRKIQTLAGVRRAAQKRRPGEGRPWLVGEVDGTR